MVSSALRKFSQEISAKIAGVREKGLYKDERVIFSRQGSRIIVKDKKEVINFCANNYLGLSAHPAVVKKSVEYITNRGAGMSSVRFICGTQDIHKELESKIADFHSRESAIAYISCFDANAGVFHSLLDAQDLIISDELNHASIVDGVRLCKAKREIYKNRDMQDLEAKLKSLRSTAKNVIIATDGVFSMDGTVAPLKEICDLADKYDALTFVDDCHATGFYGATGRGSEEFCDVSGRIDIINSTLGKAVGGAAGGYTTSSNEIVDWLRQTSRPYLFSNSLPPALVGSALAAFELIEKDSTLIKSVAKNTKMFRSAISEMGFNIIGDDHPICPIMMPDEPITVKFADQLLSKGIYVIGFTYPVVPRGKPRIRVQICASHTKEDIEKLVDSFVSVAKEMDLLKK